MNRRGFIKAFIATISTASLPQIPLTHTHNTTLHEVIRIVLETEHLTPRTYITIAHLMNQLSDEEVFVLLRYVAHYDTERFHELLVIDGKQRVIDIGKRVKLLCQLARANVKNKKTQIAQRLVNTSYKEICKQYGLNVYPTSGS